MRVRASTFAYAASVLGLAAQPVLSWGAAGKSRPSLTQRTLADTTPLTPSPRPGHEIVATIAQIHLDPRVSAQLCLILPDYAKCHLAPIAAWADTIRGRMRETGPMHYINRGCPTGLGSEGRSLKDHIYYSTRRSSARALHVRRDGLDK